MPTPEEQAQIDQAQAEIEKDKNLIATMPKGDPELDKKISSLQEDVTKNMQERPAIEEKLSALDNHPYNLKPPDYKPNFSWNDNRAYIISSAVLLLASVAGPAYMRWGSVGAMKSLTAALNGLKEGNDERYRSELEKYNYALKHITTEHKADEAKIKEILNNNKLDTTEKLQMLRYYESVRDGQDKKQKTTLDAWYKEIDKNQKLIERISKIGHHVKPVTAASLEEAAYQEAKKKNPNLTRDEHHAAYKSTKKGGGLPPRGGAAPAPTGTVTVTDPTGKVHVFPDQKSADEFKKLAGIK